MFFLSIKAVSPNQQNKIRVLMPNPVEKLVKRYLFNVTNDINET